MPPHLPSPFPNRSYKKYEEVLVPAVQPSAPPPGEVVVRIDELPEWAQLAFGGYKALNRIQSRIFRTAFTSNENMLVCAPTGECVWRGGSGGLGIWGACVLGGGHAQVGGSPALSGGCCVGVIGVATVQVEARAPTLCLLTALAWQVRARQTSPC